MLAPFAGRVRVVGEARTAPTRPSVARRSTPTSCCATCGCAAPAGSTCAGGCASAARSSRVVLLSVYDDEQYLFQALRAGAAGYLLKRISGEDLVRHLELVHAGRP